MSEVRGQELKRSTVEECLKIINAARKILSGGLSTVGHTGTFALDASNAWGEITATEAGENLLQQVAS